MKVKENREYQDEIVQDILRELRKRSISKVGAFINCGLGKTFIGCDIANSYAQKGKRVVISAYALKEIKENWINKIIDFNLINLEHLQVIVPKSNVKKYQKKYPQIHFTTQDQVDPKRKIIILIPQTIKRLKVKTDLFIIDEIHEYYEIKDKQKGEGRLKQIIKSSSHKGTKIVGLTGTGFELVQEGDFSLKKKDVSYVVRDLPFALESGSILPVKVSLEFFDFPLAASCYNSTGDLTTSGASKLKTNLKLNSKGKAVLRSKTAKRLQLDNILDKVVESKKTLVIVPRGHDLNLSVASYINLYMKKNYGLENTCLVKTSKQDTTHNDKVEQEFRNNPNVKFMVVVDMCGTGWDFEELDNVIDLTFTKNKKLVVQRWSRPCRYKRGKKPFYYFCTDQSREHYKVPVFMMQCINLTTKEGILNPQEAERKIMFPKNIIGKIAKLNGDSGTVVLGDIQKYFIGNKPRVNKRGEEIIDIRKHLKEKGEDYLWQKYVYSKLIGQSTKAINKDKCEKIAKKLNDLTKTIPQESDLFLEEVKKIVR